VRRILAEVDEAARRVARSAEGTLGTLRISFTEGMVRRPLLGRALNRFRADFPGIELRFAPMTSDLQREKLRSGEIEVGFVYEEADDARDFNVAPVGLDRIVAVVPRGHALASRPDAVLGDLAGEPMIWPSRLHSPRLFGRLATAFGSAGIMPDIAAEVAAVDIAFGLVAAGLGVALVIAPDAAPLHDDVVLVSVKGLPPAIPLSMIWRKGESAPTVSNFVGTVEAMRDAASG
jgi:DNA-binding transcriptional LysR family regulator